MFQMYQNIFTANLPFSLLISVISQSNCISRNCLIICITSFVIYEETEFPFENKIIANTLGFMALGFADIKGTSCSISLSRVNEALGRHLTDACLPSGNRLSGCKIDA